jgi:hypothetical protein
MLNFNYIIAFVWLWLPFSGVYYDFGFDKIMSDLAFNVGGAILITISILSFLFYVKLSKKITEEIQQQIFA